MRHPIYEGTPTFNPQDLIRNPTAVPVEWGPQCRTLATVVDDDGGEMSSEDVWVMLNHASEDRQDIRTYFATNDLSMTTLLILTYADYSTRDRDWFEAGEAAEAFYTAEMVEPDDGPTWESDVRMSTHYVPTYVAIDDLTA